MGTTALRIPLVIKLLGANALAIVAVLGWMLWGGDVSPVGTLLICVLAMVVFALAAARSFRWWSIEAVVSRVWRGDFVSCRIRRLPIAT
jgi:hypothetical protein